MVEPQPAPPTTTDVSTCMGTSILLTAEGEDLLWYSSLTGGSAVNTINSNPDTIGIQTYFVSQTINGCESERARSLVFNIPRPPVPGVIDVDYFLNETVMPLMAFGNQLRWYTTATSNDGTSTIPTPNTSILGIQTFWVSQMIDNCESDRIPLNVTVRERVSIGLGLIVPPTNAANGSIQLTDLLANTIYTLIYNINGNTVTTTITTDATGNYIITDLSAGNYTRIRVVLDGESSSNLEVELTPALCNLMVSFSESRTICKGDTSSIRIVIENGANPYNLTLREGASIINFPSYISGTIIPVITDTTRTYSISSLEDSNGCTFIGEENIGQVTISVQESMPPITNDIRYCQNSVVLTPLSAMGNNLLWYTSENGGTSSPIPPVPSTDVAGITTYWVSQEIDNCESARAMINVIIQEQTAPPFVTPVNYCIGAVATALSVEGTKVLWYTSENGGIGSPVAPVPSTDVAGITTYWVSQEIDNCESARARINVTIGSDQPSPPIVESVTYCQGETTVPLNVAGDNLRWYVVPTGGRGTVVMPQPTVELVGRYHLWVSQTVNGCESDLARITITIDEEPKPEIGLVIPPSPCLENGTIQLKNLKPNQNYLLSYTVHNRQVTPYSITTTDIGTHTFSGLAAGFYTDIKVQLGDCLSVGLQQTLADDTPLITVAFTGTSNVCKGEPGQLMLNIEGGSAPYKLLITDIFNTYSLSDYESGTPITVRPTKVTNYFLVSIVDSNGCIAMVENGVIRMEVNDCTSMGSLQNEEIGNRTGLLSIDTEKEFLKGSKTLDLFQNEPNPFSSETTIGFYLPGKSEVELVLRDNTGRIIKRFKEYGAAGTNHIVIEDLAETKGLIYYQLITDFGTRSKKMLLVR